MTAIRQLRLPSRVAVSAAISMLLALTTFTSTSAAASGTVAAVPSAHAVHTVVSEGTGLRASRVTSEAVCPAPRPRHATCEAQVIVMRGSHRVAHPTVSRNATFRLATHRGRVNPRLAAAAATSSSAAALTAHSPAWMQQAYDLTYLSEAQGGSDTVAIVDAGDDPSAASDLATFRSYWGLPACTTANGCFTQVGQTGSSSSLPSTASAGWREEESLDLDAVSSLCPNCHIDLVEGNSTSTSDLDAAVDEAHSMSANQISASWSGGSTAPEGEAFTGENVIASTGDSGYTGYDVAAWPAAMAGVTAAGGTTLTGSTTSATPRGYAETAWTLSSGEGGGSGCARTESKPSWQTDTGCPGRSYADVSADANPSSGLYVYDSAAGGWLLMGGTSLSAPLIAGYEAVTGVDGATPQWAYTDSALLNDPVSGSTGSCTHDAAYICTATRGYDGPTGEGSISGDVVSGAPGIGGPPTGSGTNDTYVRATSGLTATLAGGVYPNGLDTTYDWQYGTTTAYGSQTASVDAGAGSLPTAATATLTGLTPATTYHYRLVATNADGTIYGYDYTLTTGPATEVPPTNSGAPGVSGIVEQGVKLTAAVGSWSPSGLSYTYQWQLSADGSSWANISGATASTYTVPGADLGDDLRVQLTGTNAYGSATAISAAAGPVASGAPDATAAPAVSGGTRRTNVLSATVGAWTGAGLSYSYHWQRSADGSNWTTISGATASSYTLAQADEGDHVRVLVTATNAYGNASANSSATAAVTSFPPANTVAPAISGTASRGSTLKATAGSWSGPGLAIAYQWQRNSGGGFVNISGATASSYTLAVADEGDTIRAVVTASNVDGSVHAASNASGTVAHSAPADMTAPSISGTAGRGDTLTAVHGTWGGAGTILTGQWQRSSNNGSSWTNISGATGTTYKLTVDDEGDRIRYQVTGTNADGHVTASSAASATVASTPPANTTTPKISGTAKRSFALSVGGGVWRGVGNTYTFRWERSSDGGSSWTTISGATGSTRTVAAADQGSKLRVVVTATNEDGTATATTAATGVVPS
ncbi:MAG TPA: hypothetical protein VGL69_13840 [Solirubrobacteraceae bacterium]|jgi:hypothetical protein